MREYLEISQEVRTERISRFQVTDDRGRPGAALIGVVFCAHRATIYHTRALTPEDVLHELLHVAHPDWSEAAVVRATHRGWDALGLFRLGWTSPIPRDARPARPAMA